MPRFNCALVDDFGQHFVELFGTDNAAGDKNRLNHADNRAQLAEIFIGNLFALFDAFFQRDQTFNQIFVDVDLPFKKITPLKIVGAFFGYGIRVREKCQLFNPADNRFFHVNSSV